MSRSTCEGSAADGPGGEWWEMETVVEKRKEKNNGRRKRNSLHLKGTRKRERLDSTSVARKMINKDGWFRHNLCKQYSVLFFGFYFFLLLVFKGTKMENRQCVVNEVSGTICIRLWYKVEIWRHVTITLMWRPGLYLEGLERAHASGTVWQSYESVLILSLGFH